jgi:ABC-2 type transport system permease protein
MLMLLFGFIFSDSGNTDYPIYVQDLDNSNMSANFTHALKEIKSIEYHKVSSSTDPRELGKKEADFILVIPKGFQDEMLKRMMGLQNGTVNLTVYFDPSKSSTQVKMQLINGVLEAMNDQMVNATEVLGLESISIVTKNFTYIEFFIPGVIGLTVMSGAVFGTIFGDMEMKQKGIFRKLSTTPITRGEWILSNMLFQLFLAGLSVVLILLVGWLVFGATLYFNVMVILVIIFEAFAFTGLSMLIVRFVKEAQSASAVGNLITFPMMFLAGTFFPVDSMPVFLKYFAKILPLYYVNESLRQAMIFNDYLESGKNLLPIAIFAVVMFVAGVLFTTWKSD